MEPLDVCKARTVVEVPEPRVMDEPGERVWLEMTYWDWESGIIVSLFTMIGVGALESGVNALKAEVVRISEPTALVVVSIMAGRWVVRERTLPWALVEGMMVGTDAVMGARERLVEVITLP